MDIQDNKIHFHHWNNDAILYLTGFYSAMGAARSRADSLLHGGQGWLHRCWASFSTTQQHSVTSACSFPTTFLIMNNWQCSVLCKLRFKSCFPTRFTLIKKFWSNHGYGLYLSKETTLHSEWEKGVTALKGEEALSHSVPNLAQKIYSFRRCSSRTLLEQWALKASVYFRRKKKQNTQ